MHGEPIGPRMLLNVVEGIAVLIAAVVLFLLWPHGSIWLIAIAAALGYGFRLWYGWRRSLKHPAEQD